MWGERMQLLSYTSVILICCELAKRCDAIRSDAKSEVLLLVTFFNVRTPAVWSLDAWGLKSTLTLDTIKLFFELVNEAFIDVDEVKETENLHDDIEKEIDGNVTYVVR